MRSKIFLAFFAVSLIITCAEAVPVEWPSHPDGLTHYYEIVEHTYMSWNDAKDEAESRDYDGKVGNLASITSDEENTFIVNNVLTTATHANYFIGGFQDPFPNGAWQWTTGEAWNYSNWWVTEPSGDGGATIIYSSLAASGKEGKWNDLPFTLATEIYGSYVVEYVPEPATILLLGLGGFGLLRWRG